MLALARFTGWSLAEISQMEISELLWWLDGAGELTREQG